MRLQVPDEVMSHARRGIRLTPHAFMNAVQRTWPTLWRVCGQLAREQKETGERAYCDIAGYTGTQHLEILHGLAGTAVRRGLGEHFGCQLFLLDRGTAVAMKQGESESPPSTRFADMLGREFPLGADRLTRLADQARESPSGFATDERGTISDQELLQVLRIHAITRCRRALEAALGVRFAFHSPHVSAARKRGVQSVLFEAFTGIEEAVLNSSLPPQRD